MEYLRDEKYQGSNSCCVVLPARVPSSQLIEKPEGIRWCSYIFIILYAYAYAISPSKFLMLQAFACFLCPPERYQINTLSDNSDYHQHHYQHHISKPRWSSASTRTEKMFWIKYKTTYLQKLESRWNCGFDYQWARGQTDHCWHYTSIHTHERTPYISERSRWRT